MSEKGNSKYNQHEDVTLQLHKEELQIIKKLVETADVKVYKNTYTKVNEIKVPTTHEELVIKKTVLNSNGVTEEDHEIMRIPLSEDQIEVTLIPTRLENVAIYKKQIEEIVQLNETLQEEKIHIDTVGNLKVTGEDLEEKL